MKLNQSDKVAVVAPARKMTPEVVIPGIEIIRSWGLEIVQGTHLFHSHDQFAGTDNQRAKDLNQAIADPDIKAIICARGGYGCLRIIDQVDFSPMKNHFKWICGYSDVTVIHNHLLAHYNLPSIHCTMPVNMKENSKESLENLRTMLTGNFPSYTIEPHLLNREGSAEGILFGGNLSLMYALNGSSSLPDPTGKILFLEDLDEYLYHIDRMMMNLKRSGILNSIKGLIIGSFTDMKDNTIPFGKTAYQIIHEYISELNIPVCFGFPAGHIDDNRPLVIGKKITMEITSENVVITM